MTSSVDLKFTLDFFAEHLVEFRRRETIFACLLLVLQISVVCGTA